MNKLDEKINNMTQKIISRCPDGINTEDITLFVLMGMDEDTIKNLIDIIRETIDEMAVNVEVTYNLFNKKFILDFRIEEDDDLIHGKVVELDPREILFHKITYRKNLKDSIINSLLYTIVQKNVEVV